MAEGTPGRYGARPFTDREMLGAFAFLVLFGLPFAAGGTWALIQAAVKLARGELRDALVLGAMGAAFALVGFGFSAWLTYLEANRIHAWCQWCVASAIVMTLLMVVLVSRLLLSPPPGGAVAARQQLA